MAHASLSEIFLLQVPQFRPQAALHMLDRLVNYADLSPFYPTNETLSLISDDLFRKVMDKWTEAAKAEPYVTRAAWDRIPASSGRLRHDERGHSQPIRA
jgi:hypothetical protein